jgi:hypothetical protein
MGSLAGAAHLQKGIEDLLSVSHGQQKCSVDHKGKRYVHFLANQSKKARKRGLTILVTGNNLVRGEGKVTRGVTGLWQPSARSDVAF